MELGEGAMVRGGYFPVTLTAHLHFSFQIRRYPSFKRFFYRLSDSSLRKLVATLHCQEAHSAEPDRNLAEGSYPFVFDLANKPAGNNYQAVLSLVGLRYRQSSYGQFPYREAQPVRKDNMAQGGQAHIHNRGYSLSSSLPCFVQAFGGTVKCLLLAEAF